MKKLSLLLLIPILTSCASESNNATQSEIKINLPQSCLTSKVFEAVKSEVPNAQFIDSKWEPAPNTELADVLNNGGLACSYGDQAAAIGATIKWVRDGKGNFEKWVSSWQSEGYQKVNLSKYGLPPGYFLQKAQSDTQEISIWNLNFKSGGVWVSIGRTSGTLLRDGENLINAVLTQ